MKGSSRSLLTVPIPVLILMSLSVSELPAEVPELMPGWPFEVHREVFTGGVFGPVGGTNHFGDPETKLKSIAFAVSDSFYVIAQDSSVYPGWPVADTGQIIKMKSALGDINGDGLEEVVIFYHERPNRRIHRIHVMNIFGDDIPGYPKRIQAGQPDDLYREPMHSTIYDLDSDGKLEILYTCRYDTLLRILDYEGNDFPGFPLSVYPDSFIVAAISIGDLDMDGSPDIVLASNNHIFGFDIYGASIPGWPVFKPAPAYVDDFTRPVLADVDGDSLLEVIVSTCHHSNSTGDVTVYNNCGEVQAGWPYHWGNGFPVTTPVVGDIDGDDQLDIVTTVLLMTADRLMYAFNPDGSVKENWPIEIEGYCRMEPVIADVDGDGLSDIVLGSSAFHLQGDSVISYFWAYNYEGELLQGWPIEVAGFNCETSPQILDLDNDGYTNLVLTSSGMRWLDIAESAYIWCYDLGIPYNPHTIHWPQYGHDRYNTGNYHFVEPPLTGIYGDKQQKQLPLQFVLYQNYPNPFNTSTEISFRILNRAKEGAKLSIYNIRGELIRQLLSAVKTPGKHSLTWDGKDRRENSVSSGIYFYKLSAGDFSETKRMVLVK